jgi:hypothetical protein
VPLLENSFRKDYWGLSQGRTRSKTTMSAELQQTELPVGGYVLGWPQLWLPESYKSPLFAITGLNVMPDTRALRTDTRSKCEEW